MAKARREVELAVRVGNKTGALGEVLQAVSQAGVNILAYCSYSDRDEGVVLLVPEDPLRAKFALEQAGYTCQATSVVVVGDTDKVGAAARLGTYLGQAGVDIIYSYASSAEAPQFCAVFKTADDARALQTLQAANFGQAA